LDSGTLHWVSRAVSEAVGKRLSNVNVEENVMRRSLLAGLALGAVLLAGAEASAQLPDQDWTDRPDAFAPAGLMGDRLPGARALDVQLHLRHQTFQDILFGRDEVPPVIVLQEWFMVALERSRQEAMLEVAYGITDALAVGLRAPFIRNEAVFATFDLQSKVTNSGLGDVELHAMAALHRSWPVRAHLGAGIALPTGSVDLAGVTPDQPSSLRTLPYDLQPGGGVIAFLPQVQVAMENRYGTTGIQASGRVHVGENDREWRPGNVFSGHLFMQSRLNDWLGISARISLESEASVSGADPTVNPFTSPLHWPTATGGTRLSIPVGMNVRFAEGALEGHRLQAELIVPVHSDLNGPQLRSNWGAALSWGYTLGGVPRERRTLSTASPPRPVAQAPAAAGPATPPAREGVASTLCLASGETLPVFRTPEGTLLVGPERRTVAEAGGEAAVFGTGYAAGTSWYDEDRTVGFEDRTYTRAGGLASRDCDRLMQVGWIDGVALFAVRGASRPFDELVVPVRPGEWQSYRVELARVRG